MGGRFLVRMDMAAEASCASSTCCKNSRQEGCVLLRADDSRRRLMRRLHLLWKSAEAAFNGIFLFPSE